jgi:hypothetical protein
MADNSSFVVKNGIVVNTNVLVADSVNKRVGINTTTPDASLTVAGTANLQGNVIVSGGNTLTVAANSTFNGNVIVNSNTYFNERIYIGNNMNFVPLLRPVVQAVDKFNGFVQISTQNLANGTTDDTENSGTDSCSDLVVFADNTDQYGYIKFLDMGMNNSNFDGSLQYFWANNNAGSFTLGETIYQQNPTGTANIAVGVLKSVANIQFLYANLSSLSLFIGSKVYQPNTLGANIATGVVRAIEDIVANTTHKRLSVAMDYNSPSFVITTGANLAIRNISGSANSAIAALDTVQKELILSINTGYDEISTNATNANQAVRNISGTAASLYTNAAHVAQGWAGHRNFAFTIGKGNDGYLYIANGALTIGTTEGGRRAYSTALTGVSFASATNVISMTSTVGLSRDMFINGTGLANVAIRTVANGTHLVMASTTTAPSSGSYTAYDRYYDTSGNPIIFHTQGMYAESEIGRFVGNGNLVIGPNTMTRSEKLNVMGTANITGNTAIGGNTLIAGTVGITGNTTITGNANVSGSVFVGANVALTTSTLSIANGATGTANIQTTATLLKIANSSYIANLEPGKLTIGTSVVNGSYTTTDNVNTTNIVVGANVSISTSTMSVSNTTGNIQTTATLLKFANSTASANLSVAGLTVGTSVVNGTYTTTDNVNTTNILVGANVVLNTSTLSIANGATGVANIQATALSFKIANSTSNVSLTPTGIAIGANVTMGTAAVSVSNSIASANLTVAGLLLGNSTVNTVANSTSLITGTSVVNTTYVSADNVNTASFVVGANVAINTSTISVSNTTGNIQTTATLLKVANSTVSANLTTAGLIVGTSFVNASMMSAGTANTNQVTVGANVSISTSTLSIANGATGVANIQATATSLQVSNSIASANLTVAGLLLGNSSVNSVSNSTSLTIGTTVVNTSTVAANLMSITGNSTFGGNLVVTTNTLFVDTVAKRVGVNNSTPSHAFSVQGDVYVTGNFTVGGTTTTTSTSVASGDFIPNISGQNLGNVSNRWILYSTVINASASVFTGSNVGLTNTGLTVANGATGVANVQISANTILIQNGAAYANLNPDKLAIGTSYVNSSAVAAGANVYLDTAKLNISNGATGTGNVFANASLFKITDGTYTANLTSNEFKIGVAGTANATLNSTALSIGPGTANTITTSITATAVTIQSNATVNAYLTATGLYMNGVIVANSTYFSGTALNANNAANAALLNNQAGSWYVDATNMTGTIPSARISGNYTGITNVGTLGVASITGNVSAANFSSTVNATSNVVTIGASNVAIDTNVLFVDSVANRVGVNNGAPDAALSVTGTANVSGNTYFGTSANNILLTVNGTAAVFTIGNSTVYSTINSTAFTGTAANATNLNGQLASYYLDATNINTGTLNSARISGNYTGITNVGTLGVATITGNVSAANFSSTVNASSNVVTIGASNVAIDTNVLFVDSVANRVGVNNGAPDAALAVTGTANISGNTFIGTAANSMLLTANGSAALFTIGNSTVYATINSTAYTGTATNASQAANAALLNNQAASYYLNASNFNTGTLPTGRISGDYTGITNVGTLGVLAVSGNTTLAGLTSNSSLVAASANLTLSANLTVSTNALFVDVTTKRVGIANNTPDSALTVSGSANISGNVAAAYVNATTAFVSGNSSVNSVANSSQLLIKNVDNTLTIQSGAITVANTTSSLSSVVNSSAILVGAYNSTANGVLLTSSQIIIGNNSVNSTINSTVYTGTATNAAYLGGLLPASYQNVSSLGTAVAALTAGDSSKLGGTAAALYQTRADLSANVLVLSSNNASYLGTVAASNYVNTSGSYTLAGNLNLTAVNNYFSVGLSVGANVVANVSSIKVSDSATSTVINSNSIKLGGVVYANSGTGSAGQFLTSGASGNSYWSNLSSTLTGLSSFTSTGIMTQTVAGTFAARTISPGTGISILYGDGVSGNPTIAATVSTTDTALNAGYTTTAVSDGTKTTGTYTPSPAGGNIRTITNNAGTIATTGATYSSVTGYATITFAGSYVFTVGQTVTIAGVTPTGYNGTWTVVSSSAGSVTIDPAVALTTPATVQGTITNGFFIGAPTTSGDYTMVVQVTNSTTPGAISLSGFSKSTGSPFTIASGAIFLLYITKIGTLKVVNVVAI